MSAKMHIFGNILSAVYCGTLFGFICKRSEKTLSAEDDMDYNM